MNYLRRLVPTTPSTEFESLAFEHLEVLYATAIRLTRNPKDAEDLVQDTYLKAFRFFDRFERGTNIKAWLFKIQMNTFINRYRRKVREREVAEMPVEDLMHDRFVSSARCKALEDPERNFIDQLLSDEVMAAMEKVPVDFRMVVVLSDIEGLSYKEIAEIVGCPLGTVMSRLFRGRRLLQAELYEFAIQEGIIQPNVDDDDIPVNLATFREQKKKRCA